MKMITVMVLFGTLGLAQAGHWEGKIQIPERELSIVVDLARSPQGVWTGSMRVLGSSGGDVPLNGLAMDGASVRFTAALPERASFDGRLSADAASLSGTASSAAGEAPFQLTRNGEANVKLPPPSSALSKDFEGEWQGTIDSGGQVRRVGLKLAAAADGAAMGTLISIDKGIQLPATTVTIRDKELVVEVRSVSGVYRGTLGSAGEIAGEWQEGTSRMALTFKRAASGK